MRRFNGQRREALQSPFLLVTQLGRDRDYAAATRSHCCVHRDGSCCSAEIEHVFIAKSSCMQSLSLSFCGTRQLKASIRGGSSYTGYSTCVSLVASYGMTAFNRCCAKRAGWGSSIQTQGNRQRKIGVIPSNDMHLQKECMLRYVCKVSSCSYPDPQARTLR
jgi:hypothetical protein